MDQQPRDATRLVILATTAIGAAAVITGLLIALSQSVAPYTCAGGLVTVGMFTSGIGIGGVLFTPRKTPASRHKT
ncbi:hypothetical protein [Arsenicicoccus dermatophilus]|uniref:hypothetical protein n=1 Tax=Arsenicicoccus dermatophilus TaxID=1076331 RepID=UPI001F4CEC76|nr:hypothetical protein [Arsenicicoccus dermatophilus]MCH8614429.1 hypothetical protein [Arsenicicoccus dermatophilus]